MLPFTRAQFADLFVQYNADVWPAQVAAYLVGLAVVTALLRPSAYTGRVVAIGLGAMWLWTGVAYHVLHFSRINQAAFLFGALFVLQGLLLWRAGWRRNFDGAAAGGARGWLGWGLVSYASVLYPLLGLWTGHGYAQLPMFGITPCPVTLFTFGVLLVVAGRVSWTLLAIPLAWSVIGGSAAFLLQVPQDWLLFSGFVVVPMLLHRTASAEPQFKG